MTASARSTPSTLSILYRGPLASCNYACGYCPFALRVESTAELEADRRALERFCARVEALADRRLSVFFTPYGEALVRAWYRDAVARLSHLAHVEKVAVQTNLSCGTGFLDRCDLAKVALWASWHPTQISREDFAAKVRTLVEKGVRLSVGAVAVEGALEEIEAMRAALPPDVYLWVNAAKRVHGPYAGEDLARLERIDPLFRLNTRHHASRGLPCRAGESVVSVDGDGVVRRCHFIRERIGNFYDDAFFGALQPRACTNDTCGCHIGYVHLEPLGLYEVFAEGVLERIPGTPIWRAERA